MDTKINIKSKVILMLIFTVIATISCQTNKEIAHQSDQLDSLSDYSGSSGYFIDDRDGKPRCRENPFLRLCIPEITLVCESFRVPSE